MMGLRWAPIFNMRTKIQNICKYCKNNYFGYGKIYCSKSCRAKDTGVGHGTKTGKHVLCHICKKEIWRKGYSLKQHKLFFCSNRCHAIFKKTLDMSWCTGPKQWNWKGGISFLGKKLDKQIRKIKKYINWRENIYKRNNYICKNCQKRGGKLNADHFPIPFSMIMKNYNIKNLEEALNCKALWDVNNGRTLCEPCHLEIGWRGSHLN